MCLYQIDLDDENFILVMLVQQWTLLTLKMLLETLYKKLQRHDTVLQTDLVKLKGMIYRVVSVILWKYNEVVLEFCEIICIYVSNNVKYIPCKHLKVIEYKPIFNAFAYFRTEEEFCSRVIDLKYQWPKTHHSVNGQMYVMLSNVDFCWSWAEAVVNFTYIF